PGALSAMDKNANSVSPPLWLNVPEAEFPTLKMSLVTINCPANSVMLPAELGTSPRLASDSARSVPPFTVTLPCEFPRSPTRKAKHVRLPQFGVTFTVETLLTLRGCDPVLVSCMFGQLD